MKNHTKRGKLNVVEWKSYKRVKREVSALTHHPILGDVIAEIPVLEVACGDNKKYKH